jgi:hypothetical protein
MVEICNSKKTIVFRNVNEGIDGSAKDTVDEGQNA